MVEGGGMETEAFVRDQAPMHCSEHPGQRAWRSRAWEINHRHRPDLSASPPRFHQRIFIPFLFSRLWSLAFLGGKLGRLLTDHPWSWRNRTKPFPPVAEFHPSQQNYLSLNIFPWDIVNEQVENCFTYWGTTDGTDRTFPSQWYYPCWPQIH